MFWQLPPFELQRSQWYENDVGLLSQEPLDAVRVSPARSVPEIEGGEVLTGAAFDAPCAAPPARSISTAPTPATSLFMAVSVAAPSDCYATPNRILTRNLPGEHSTEGKERWDTISR